MQQQHFEERFSCRGVDGTEKSLTLLKLGSIRQPTTTYEPLSSGLAGSLQK